MTKTELLGVERGRLFEKSTPQTGEHFSLLHQGKGVRIEEITSSSSLNGKTYVQAHDEWVVLLRGRAELAVADDMIALEAGDWIFLPAQVPHRILFTECDSVWLAVHSEPSKN